MTGKARGGLGRGLAALIPTGTQSTWKVEQRTSCANSPTGRGATLSTIRTARPDARPTT